MKEKEIIQALECCSKDDCDNCPNTFGNCYANLAGEALDLINRHKAEIDRMKMENEKAKGYIANLFDKYEKTKIAKDSLENTKYTVRAEAIKEFADKLKEKFLEIDYCARTKRNTVSVKELHTQVDWVLHDVSINMIDDLVAEMVGTDNE